MLYIDCAEKNVVMASDLGLIQQAVEDRWDGSFVLIAYLGGHARSLPIGEIPKGDPESDMAASRFWRGVDPE